MIKSIDWNQHYGINNKQLKDKIFPVRTKSQPRFAFIYSVPIKASNVASVFWVLFLCFNEMKSKHAIYYLSTLVFVGNTFEKFTIWIIYLCVEDFSGLSASLLDFHAITYLPAGVVLFDFFFRWCLLFFTRIIFSRAAALFIAWALRLQLIGASKLPLLDRKRRSFTRSIKTFVGNKLFMTKIRVIQITWLIHRLKLHM